MKIQIDSVYVNIEAENDFDVFYLGQLHGDMLKQHLFPHALVASEKKSFARLNIKKEEFISYLIHKVNA